MPPPSVAKNARPAARYSVAGQSFHFNDAPPRTRVPIDRRERSGVPARATQSPTSDAALAPRHVVREWENSSVETEKDTVQQAAAPPADDWHYALLFLPARRREAARALQAFRADVRGATENVRDPGVAHAKLDWWHREIDAAFDGTPNHPTMRALAPHLAEFGIAREPLHDVVRGAEMDLTQFRYFSYDELRRYCVLVSGSAAAALVRIFNPATDPGYAQALGLALHLTAMIRDVGGDARHSRIYLPADELDQFGVPDSEILSATMSDRFQKLMQFQIERARQACDAALAALPMEQRNGQKPSLTLLSIARQLLKHIEAEHHAVLTQRIDLPHGRKLWLAWKMQALGRF